MVFPWYRQKRAIVEVAGTLCLNHIPETRLKGTRLYWTLGEKREERAMIITIDID